jgi:predicted house-cleaning noncanonical NTP pyrophosphatase (MazG superfamily)
MTLKLYGIFEKALTSDSATKRGAYVDLIEENRLSKSRLELGTLVETLADLLAGKPASNRRAITRLLGILETEFVERLKGEKDEKISDSTKRNLSDILEVLMKAETTLEQRTFNSPTMRKKRKKRKKSVISSTT